MIAWDSGFRTWIISDVLSVNFSLLRKPLQLLTFWTWVPASRCCLRAYCSQTFRFIPSRFLVTAVVVSDQQDYQVPKITRFNLCFRGTIYFLHIFVLWGFTFRHGHLPKPSRHKANSNVREFFLYNSLSCTCKRKHLSMYPGVCISLELIKGMNGWLKSLKGF